MLNLFLILMNISIQQYRARIGLHNNCKCKEMGSSQPSNFLVTIYDSLHGLVSAAGICLSYILLSISILNYLLDVFHDFIVYGRPTLSVSCPNYAVANSSKFIMAAIDYRIFISCISYCMIYIIQESLLMLSKSNYKNCLK